MMNPEGHCISYKCPFVHTDFETVRLKNQILDANGDTYTASCDTCVFNGTFGIEGLLYVEERFRQAATDELVLEEVQYFEKFPRVLRDAALTNWTNLTVGLTAADKTLARFNTKIEEFYRCYCTEDARDVMFEYLRSQCRKPVNSDPQTHVNRMLTLFRYSNKLPGFDQVKDEPAQRKTIFFTFPGKWTRKYMESGKNIPGAPNAPANEMQIITDYMNHQKAFDDAEERKKKESGGKRSSDNNEGRRGGNKKNRSVRPDDPCPLHPAGNHKWIECFDNPRGPNFCGSTSGGSGGRGFRNGGRGGFGGRGNYRGGGGRFGGRFNGGRFGGNNGGRGAYQQPPNNHGQGGYHGGRGTPANGGGQYHFQPGAQGRFGGRQGNGPTQHHQGPTHQDAPQEHFFYDDGFEYYYGHEQNHGWDYAGQY